MPIAVVEVEAVAGGFGGLVGFRTLFSHGAQVTMNAGKAVKACNRP